MQPLQSMAQVFLRPEEQAPEQWVVRTSVGGVEVEEHRMDLLQVRRRQLVHHRKPVVEQCRHPAVEHHKTQREVPRTDFRVAAQRKELQEEHHTSPG